MLCDKCKSAPATSHIKRNINGNVEEFHLCAKCAAEEGLSGSFDQFGFGGMLGSFLGYPIAKSNKISVSTKVCSFCKTDFAHIAKTGNVGCAHCYEEFKESLLPYIQRIHGKTNHTGKTPSTAGKRYKTEREISDLNEELNNAISSQEFEKAAQLRDRINELKRSEESDE